MENGSTIVSNQQAQLSPEAADRKMVTMRKPNNGLNVVYTDPIDFYKKWCVIIRPFVYLTDREIDVVASFLKNRWELSKVVSDASVLDAMMMNDDTKRKVKEECHISPQHFYVVMNSLKKKGLIDGNTLSSKIIPNVRVDDNGVFRLLIQFRGDSPW